MFFKPFFVFLFRPDGRLELIVGFFDLDFLPLEFDIGDIIKHTQVDVRAESEHGQAFFQSVGEGFLGGFLVGAPVFIRCCSRPLHVGCMAEMFNNSAIRPALQGVVQAMLFHPHSQLDGMRGVVPQDFAIVVVYRRTIIDSFLDNVVAPIEANRPPLLSGFLDHIGAVDGSARMATGCVKVPGISRVRGCHGAPERQVLGYFRHRHCLVL